MRLLGRLDGLAVRCADVVILDTEERQALLAERARHKAVVVPVGASRDWFEAGKNRAAAAVPAGYETIIWRPNSIREFLCTPGSPGPPDITFDAVRAFGVLEHIDEDQTALAAWSRSFVRGGHLIMSVPAFQDRFGPMGIHAGHFRRYSPTSYATAAPRPDW